MLFNVKQSEKIMEKINICRFCLANSVNTNIIQSNATIEYVLQKYDFSFKVRKTKVFY